MLKKSRTLWNVKEISEFLCKNIICSLVYLSQDVDPRTTNKLFMWRWIQWDSLRREKISTAGFHKNTKVFISNMFESEEIGSFININEIFIDGTNNTEREITSYLDPEVFTLSDNINLDNFKEVKLNTEMKIPEVLVKVYSYGIVALALAFPFYAISLLYYWVFNSRWMI